MVHIVQLRMKKNRLFGQAKNGSVWTHNYADWTTKQLDGLRVQATAAADQRQIDHCRDEADNYYEELNHEGNQLRRYIDIDRQHWTKVRGAA